jgi:hypothetical protein
MSNRITYGSERMKKQIKITEIILEETQGITLAKYLLSIGKYKKPNKTKVG